MTYLLALTIAWTLFLIPTTSKADWSMNLGYNNPPGATVGVNMLYRGSKLGFEVGVGWVNVDAYVEDDDDNNDDNNEDTSDDESDSDDEDKSGADIAIAGDIDLKYFFSRSGFSPYLQAGLGTGLSGEIGNDSGASAGLGSPYGGVGFIAGSDLYLYLSANANSKRKVFFQAGVGFDI